MLRDRSIVAIVSGEGGVTLAEILVATIVISVGLVGLAMVIPLSSYGVHEGNTLSTATFLAEEKLEEIRHASWTSTPSEKDCLGVGSGLEASDTEPTSSTCTRTQPTSCTTGTTCTTFAGETSVSGYPQYSRIVRIRSCDSAACAGVTDSNMRLVRVTVKYRAMSGVGGPGATTSRSAVLEMIIAKRQ